MKKTYAILLLLFVVFFGCTKKDIEDKNETSTLDSLSTYLRLANDDSLSFKDKQEYNKKAFFIIINEKDDSLNKVNLFKVANRYYNMSDWDAYKETTKLILERSRNSNDSVHMAKAYTYLGDYYSSKSISDSAFMNYYKAEKVYLRINDENNLAKTFLSKANLQYNEGDLFESEITVFKVLRILKQQKNVNDLFYNSYNLLGILYNEREEYNKALEFHNKALLTIDDKTVPSGLQLRATSLNNVGFVYLKMRNYKQAKVYFQKGLDQKRLFKDSATLYAMLLDNLAYSKFKLNETEGMPEQFYQALKIRDSLNLTSGIILNKIHLSEYYAYKKDTLKAIDYSEQALKLSRSSNKPRNTLEVLKQIALVDPEKASAYSKEYIQINERVQKAERKMGEKFSRIEYETNEIKDENTSLNIQNRTLMYVFSICTLLALFFYVYMTQKAKNRELLFKQQQQVANEDIYNLMISQQNVIEGIRIKEKKKVAQDLHDGVLGRMFGVRISLDSLDKVDDPTAAVKRKKYLSDLKEIEQDIREISHDLNKEKSELINNFVVIIDKLLENQRATFKSKLISAIDSSIRWDLVSNSIKINLYRIIQEALQNCNKYAHAETIKIELKNEVNHLSLLISDDGVGFNVNRTKKGIGLQNIFYRVKECDGTVDIKSNKADGTVITIKIPIDQKINLQHNDN
ncbi:tetratricopeptide repeat-containing sensor histidine kinase [Flavobacterium hydatis]|uniref:histidine kinase n=1 Tax=Flavobacterium hydatis TaxID=991 RepID=A0A086AUR7_FLAHY|nr:tetratricopeptide repeat-containing sensor histidine kinase [Flavobacterium hydatis]KFF20431.1 histidine kinase [Flavobacterium hydatis]OXA98286.1 two-component sensor histidine kinase [Flavobacterium hydatis]